MSNLLSLSLLTVFLVEPTATERAKAALALASARPAASDCYDVAYVAAVRGNHPLVVFVRQLPRAVTGCVICRVESFPGQLLDGVIVALPDGLGGLDEVARQDGYPTQEALERLVKEMREQRLMKTFMRVPVFRQPFVRAGGC